MGAGTVLRTGGRVGEDKHQPPAGRGDAGSMGKNLRCGTVGVVSANVGDADGVTTCCFRALRRGFSGVDGGAWMGGGRLCNDVENQACVLIEAASGRDSASGFKQANKNETPSSETPRSANNRAAAAVAGPSFLLSRSTFPSDEW